MRLKEYSVITRSEKETACLGALLGRMIEEPMVIALKGDLGAGKTVFVRGAAMGLGVNEQVTSPTFVLLKVYRGRFPIYHFDYYRLNEGEDEEAIEMGFEEYLPGDGVAFVEWAERLPLLLPVDYLEIYMELFFDKEGEGRRLTFVSHGKLAASIVGEFANNLSADINGASN